VEPRNGILDDIIFARISLEKPMDQKNTIEKILGD
jgi:hypothetical protein